MLLRLIGLLAVAVLAACGGNGGDEEQPVDAFRAFAQAAAGQNGDKVWDSLSERITSQVSKDRFTAPAVLKGLSDEYTSVSSSSARTALDVRLGDDLALVALDGGEGVKPMIMRREDGKWRAQLNELTVAYSFNRPRFGVEVPPSVRGPIKTRAWIDGKEARVVRTHGTPPTFRIVPGTGKHNVIAYAEAGGSTGAAAWTIGA
ncbi:MAG TPA: hypothetical protein VHI55_04775 [Gaiellaceae bacterium]|jgi:hypothetical protein|nr:hypothetical protein [Gaiellaceae bacterium]